MALIRLQHLALLLTFLVSIIARADVGSADPAATAGPSSPAQSSSAPLNTWYLSIVSKGLNEDFGAIKYIASEAVKLCPTHDCLFVGVGRSPSPIIALLQSFIPYQARNLPLSTNTVDADYRKVPLPADLPADVRQELYQHFDRFFPDLNEYRGKKVIFIDLVLGGKSYSIYEQWLRQYFNEKAIDVEFLVYSNNGGLESLRGNLSAANTSPLHTIELPYPGSFMEHSVGELYDPVAEYPSYRPGYGSSRALRSVPEYAEVRKYLQGLAQEDRSEEIRILREAATAKKTKHCEDSLIP